MSRYARRFWTGRSDRLRKLAARLYRLAEDTAIPSHGFSRAERLIEEAEDIAHAVRREFR